ncbi:TPA: AbrB/MazE/SpoVT family DNA-binding domain-containing protein [Proteus mirabilis]
MTIVIGKWGNGAALRIPQPFMKQLGLNIGDNVKFRIAEKDLVITKAGPTLEELLGQCNAENSHGEYFSDSYGKELL